MGSTNSKSDSGNVAKNVYSTILQGTEEKNSTPIYRSIHNKQGLQSFIEFEEDGTVVRTLWESWKRGVKISKRRPCMGFKKPGNPFMWMCYDECHTRVLRFGSGLTRLLSNEIRYVGVCMRNRMEWSICEHACSGYNIVLVPLFPDISNENLFHILNETKLSTVVCEHDGLFFRRDSLKEIREKCPHLKNLIVANTNNRSMKMVRDTTVLSFESVEEIGMESLVVPTPPKPDDVATLCYTSGTTGLPKGAILSHQNIISACAGILQSQVEFCLSKRDVHLSYLPLSHIFERLVETAMWCHGGSVGYFSGGNNKALPAILKALRPTIFPSVPRLFYKLHDKITSKVEGSGMFKRWMFSTAFESKEYNLRNNATFENNFWDAVVFKKVKAQIGLDRVRYLITGSAPISDHVVQFLRVVFGVPILEGYGQTEGAAGATCTLSTDTSLGHVGGPLACCEMKLVDVPEMNYLSTDRVHVLHSNEKIECRGRGEIYIRGPNVFRGYYQREDLTRQALEDKNTGWLKTGDIGVFLPNGALKIVDRRKNIFKLQQGEYVVPEKIESVYANSKFCDQVFVDGDSLHAHVVGVVVANPASIKRWASKRGIDCDDIASICSRKDLKRDILKELRRLESKYKLRYYERLHDIYVSFEPFSPENGLLTPTYKLKRNVARSRFSKQIANMQADVKIAGRKGLRQGRVVSCEPFSNSENKTPTHKKLKHNVKIMGRKVSRQGRVAVLGDLSNVRQY